MKAYHGKNELKEMVLAEVRLHREQDQLIKGSYAKRGQKGEFKGCAVGCTINSLNVKLGKDILHSNHGAYETELGVPRILARLEDGIFEGLPQAEAMAWPTQFLEAIPVGADLSGVWDAFAHWLLVDPMDGVIKFAKTDSQRKAIQGVADLYARRLKGETVTLEEWQKSRADAAAYAYAAAAYAAAAAAAAAAYAAYAAAYAAADAADAAADAAAARSKARIRQAEKLIELLKAAPVDAEKIAA